MNLFSLNCVTRRPKRFSYTAAQTKNFKLCRELLTRFSCKRRKPGAQTLTSNPNVEVTGSYPVGVPQKKNNGARSISKVFLRGF